MFGTDIQQIVILMVDRDLIFQEFLVKPAEFNVLLVNGKEDLLTLIRSIIIIINLSKFNEAIHT